MRVLANVNVGITFPLTAGNVNFDGNVEIWDGNSNAVCFVKAHESGGVVTEAIAETLVRLLNNSHGGSQDSRVTILDSTCVFSNGNLVKEQVKK